LHFQVQASWKATTKLLDAGKSSQRASAKQLTEEWTFEMLPRQYPLIAQWLSVTFLVRAETQYWCFDMILSSILVSFSSFRLFCLKNKIEE
jgi:hypothetical protein